MVEENAGENRCAEVLIGPEGPRAGFGLGREGHGDSPAEGGPQQELGSRQPAFAERVDDGQGPDGKQASKGVQQHQQCESDETEQRDKVERLRAQVTPAGRGMKAGVSGRCGGKVRIIASIEDPQVIGRILAHIASPRTRRSTPSVSPRLGRMVPELNEEAVREIPLYSYRILYEIKPEHIDVLAVIHKRRDLQPEDIPRGQ